MAIITKISGPVVTASQMKGQKMYDVVRVGKDSLLGEIIRLKDDLATIQVYEDTTGLKPGEKVTPTGSPLSIELGPGLLSTIYDGIARPLKDISEKSGDFIARGTSVNCLDRKRKWDFIPSKKIGDHVNPGETIGTVQETQDFVHNILCPPYISGKIKSIKKGTFTVDEVVCVLESSVKGEANSKQSSTNTKSPMTHMLKMFHEWPVRIPRPIKERLVPDTPLVTGQRVFDTFFTLSKGGTAAIPGPFGAGKTVSQHQLAKWSDAKVIVYVGCGERGNEMTEVLDEFPNLIDPTTKRPLMERTVLIANTSNMPVAAREASIYSGATIAEYFRDQGFDVALMADSTSRWAEALREISSRLEEMPGEEGYPAYLGSRLAQFYERAGKVNVLSGAVGSLSIIGAVSPPGGDFSEPVTQNTLRITKVFWALDAPLAYRRHFPAINWLNSYSLYHDNVSEHIENNVSSRFVKNRKLAMAILQKESELKEIVQLVGPDALSEEDKVTMDTAKSIREDYLQQNAYHDEDSYCSLKKQDLMLTIIIALHDKLHHIVKKGIKKQKYDTEVLQQLREKISRIKYAGSWDEQGQGIISEIDRLTEKTFANTLNSSEKNDAKNASNRG